MTDQPLNKPIIFELRRLSEYTDEAVLDELRRVASLTPDRPFTQRVFDKHSRVARTTVLRRFGSWEQALRVAGLQERWSGQQVSSGGVHIRRMSNEEILGALKDLALRLGKNELTVFDIESNLSFGRGTLISRWGSTRKALEIAGLGTSPLGRRYTDEECFNNLLEIWTHYGRSPQYREMGLPPSNVGGKAYIKRFGTWNKALAAFVDRVNADEKINDNSSSTRPADETEIEVKTEQTISEKEEKDTRNIPLGLRFRVLYRDRFKCVLCGDSPSINPKCVLHVDHIIPWSKNGPTVIDNLRSLCDLCNIGRGNRYKD